MKKLFSLVAFLTGILYILPSYAHEPSVGDFESYYNHLGYPFFPVHVYEKNKDVCNKLTEDIWPHSKKEKDCPSCHEIVSHADPLVFFKFDLESSPDRESLDALLKTSPQLNCFNKYGWTPLTTAVKAANLYLGRYGPDSAETQRAYDIVETLLQHGAHPDFLDNRLGGGRDSALLLSVLNGKSFILADLLLSYGANVDVLNIHGRTPLMELVKSSYYFRMNKNLYYEMKKRYRAIQFLLDKGASTSRVDFQGRTMYKYLTFPPQFDRSEILKLIGLDDDRATEL